MKKSLIVLGICIVAALAWYLLSPIWRVSVANDASPVTPLDGQSSVPVHVRIIAQAAFVPRAHDVQGNALLIEKNGKKILRFENFSTVNGPDLHIYLATGLGGKPYVDLGPIRATRGNVNYELDDSIDLATYRTVLVWCKPFGVLFGSASL
ncbi:DM13 domain-containing protein [Candidatus Peregrinibacteria bacterium]|nr:DM13 domain-containing protein [Candidatus Peregrinibacteria bacterium]MBI3816330.1 DM13 domain-containing protein [Candidatus Peregrinibacteria bacterium]